jgi:hypothetical protein
MDAAENESRIVSMLLQLTTRNAGIELIGSWTLRLGNWYLFPRLILTI